MTKEELMNKKMEWKKIIKFAESILRRCIKCNPNYIGDCTIDNKNYWIMIPKYATEDICAIATAANMYDYPVEQVDFTNVIYFILKL